MAEPVEVVWLLVTSGRGPGECQLAVTKLAAELERRAGAGGLEAETVDAVSGEAAGGALSALVKVEGDGARAFAARWRGSVQWIAPSPLRPTHKRKNWFVGVEVLGGIEDGAGIRIGVRDVVFESMRASGSGGQHVNKTESAVRATHRPTGLVATAREERSQAMNKRLALARLQALADAAAEDKAAAAGRDRWAAHDALERGHPVAVFSGPEFRERR